MSIYPFHWMRLAIHKKTMIAIMSFALVSCASEEETVEEPITADEIHAIESTSSETDSEWSMAEDEGYVEESTLLDAESTPPTLATTEQQTEQEHPDIIGDFPAPVDNTQGDWTSTPADEAEEAESASFVPDSNENSDSFITAMTDVKEIESSFQPETGGRYIVQPGDSLSKIAAKIYGSTARWREIASTNSIDGNFVIHPGDTVQFEVDTDHARTFVERFDALPRSVVTVQKGDSLSKIAVRIYGKANYWKVLMTLNEDIIDSPDKIFVGAQLKYVKPDALNTFAGSSDSKENRALAQATE